MRFSCSRFKDFLVKGVVATGLLASWAHGQQAFEPKVNADRSVAFRYVDPSAAKVTVSLEGLKAAIPMQKDAAGVWTGSSAVLAPEIYSYHFDVDERTQLDPRNTLIKTSYLSAGNAFLVPGARPEPWEVTPVPHGTVHQHSYTSNVVAGLDRHQSEFYVYTPPGYDPRGSTKYPVLYLLHGWSDAAGAWSSFGHANDILDNLIAEGKARPMIVVMPLGYGDMSFVLSGAGAWKQSATVEHNTSLFTKALLTEVLPRVEKEYNVSTRREDHAIAGLSMGGLESLSIGLNHTDQFAWVGGFSSAVHFFGEANGAEFPKVESKTDPLKLLWIACGTSDDLLAVNRSLIATLKADGYALTAIETPGSHTWMVWRDNLIHFAPLLFQAK